MRTPDDICLLCQERKATQKNSHIIPKFFGDGIFYNTKPRHGIALNRNGNQQKIQDLKKENYLLCPNCEKGISVIEGYCALKLRQIEDISFNSLFNHFKNGDFEYDECKKIDIRIFNLFIYSIIWRVSISNDPFFNKFKLQHEEEMSLRKILKEFSFTNQNELLDNIPKLIELPKHSHVIIKPKRKLRPPNSMLSAAPLESEVYLLFLVDYVVFYATNQAKLVEAFRQIDNNNLDSLVKVGKSNTEDWKKFNMNEIRKVIK